MKTTIPKLPTGLAASALLATTLVVASPARAQDDASTDDLSVPARALFMQARAARSENQYEKCYEIARAAWDTDPKPRVAGVLGDCAYDLGKFGESATRLAFFLANPPAGSSDKLIAFLQGRFDKAKQRAAAVTLRPSVATAVVTVDGEPLDALIYLDPGTHTFTATAAGYEKATLTRDVALGTHTIDLPLAPTTVPAPPPNGDTPNEPSAAYWPLVGTGIGVTVAALAVGLAFRLGVAPGQRDDATALGLEISGAGGCSALGARCAELDDMVGDARFSEDFSTGMFIGAGVVGAATILYAVLARPSGETSGTTVVPMLGPTVVGLGVQMTLGPDF